MICLNGVDSFDIRSCYICKLSAVFLTCLGLPGQCSLHASHVMSGFALSCHVMHFACAAATVFFVKGCIWNGVCPQVGANDPTGPAVRGRWDVDVEEADSQRKPASHHHRAGEPATTAARDCPLFSRRSLLPPQGTHVAGSALVKNVRQPWLTAWSCAPSASSPVQNAKKFILSQDQWRNLRARQ